MNNAVPGLKISQDEVDALKQRHGKVFRGKIIVHDPGGASREVVFLFREARHKDSEAMAQKSRSNPAAADRNLLSSLIVHPQNTEVMAQLRDSPLAVANFLSEQVLPFLGSNSEAEATEI